MSRIGRRARRLALATAALGMVAVAAVPATADATLTPVAEGFVSPLGLAVSQNGTIHVAEAFIGQLTAVHRDGSRTSVAGGEGGELFTAGVDARGNDVAFTLTVFPEDGSAPDTTLNRLLPNGRTQQLASLQAFEEAVNPDADTLYGFLDGLSPQCAAEWAEAAPPFLATQPYSGIIESNPYAVAIDRSDWIVADAAGNSIVRVRPNGSVSAVAVLPPIAQVVSQDAADEYGLPDCVVGLTYHGEPVPTDVEVGPDGHYYVSALPGFPEAPGAGAVFRIHRSTGEVTLVASGFSFAVDLAVAGDGTIYVAELVVDFMTFEGRISQISPSGAVSTVVSQPGLMPGAIEVVRHGRTETIYATIGAFDVGSVVIVNP